MPNIPVLIADQYSVVREGLRAILARDKSLRVVGEATNGMEAVKLAKKLKPAVVLMDIDLPLMDGIEACRQIIEFQPEARVIFLSGKVNPILIEESVRVQACGYLRKSDPVNGLPAMVRAAADGKPAFAPDIAEHIRLKMKLPNYGNRILCGLSDRQRQIAHLVHQGYIAKDIAVICGIRTIRVEKEFYEMGKKLRVGQRGRAAKSVIAEWGEQSRNGWG